MTSTAAPPPRAGRREWIGLAVLALPMLLASMDLTVLHLAVPELSRELEPSSSQLLWITDIYGFMLAGLLVTMGTLGDRIGRRRLLMIGAAAFSAASVLAAFSTSAEMLIATRALLGVAGATLMPSTFALLRNLFADPRQRTMAIAIMMTSFATGASLGPLVGGAMLELFWWGSVFLLGVPVMLLLLAVGPALLPESRDEAAGALDLPSALLALVAMLSAIYGVKDFAEHGAGWLPATTIAAGLAVGTAFVARQRRLRDPLVDLRLFKAPAFSAALGTQTLAVFTFAGVYFFIGQYLQLVLGLSPIEAGLWTLPGMAAGIVGQMGAPLLVRHLRPSVVIAGGLAVAAAGFLVLTQVEGRDGLAAAVVALALVSLGLGPALTLTVDLLISSAPPERAGSASALSETGGELGTALGIALLGSLGTAVYRSEVADGLPDGVSPAATDAARDTLGGATLAADGLDEPQRTGVLDAAQGAFVEGLQVTATASTALALAIAAVAAVLLRHLRAQSGGAAA